MFSFWFLHEDQPLGRIRISKTFIINIKRAKGIGKWSYLLTKERVKITDLEEKYQNLLSWITLHSKESDVPITDLISIDLTGIGGLTLRVYMVTGVSCSLIVGLDLVKKDNGLGTFLGIDVGV